VSAFWVRLRPTKTSVPPAFGARARAASLAASVAVGLAAFLVYLSTMTPTVVSLDGGRFQIAAPLLGTAHPTGYPTFILLGHLFTYLPFGDVAYRVSLLSAVSGAVAVALFVPVARALGSSLAVAAGVALLYAFSSTFWSQATFAEVYTLHAAFLLAVLLLLLRWRATRRGRYAISAALLYGLALGNNAGTVLLAPAYLVLLLDRRGRPPLGTLARAGAAGLAGLSVYAYLPIRGFAGAWHNYGDPVGNWGDVWRLVSGARFRGLMDASPANLARGASDFAVSLSWQAPHPLGYFVGLMLAVGGVCGVAIVLRRDRAVGFSLMLALAATLAYALGYRIADVYVYYLPVYLLLALALAVALSALDGALAGAPDGPLGSPRGLAPFAFLVPLVVAGVALVWDYGWHDRSWDYTPRERAEAILAQLPEGAVLYGRAEILPVTYLKEVEGEREDVALRWMDGAAMSGAIPDDLRQGRTVYLTSPPSPDEYPEAVTDRARPVQEGRLVRLADRREP